VLFFRYEKWVLLIALVSSTPLLASEAWVRCYGQEIQSEVDKCGPDLKLWINERSNIEVSLIETGKPAKMVDNSNDIATNPIEQYFLLPGSLAETVHGDKVFVVQPLTYDALIKICVHTLNRGYGRKSENFRTIKKGYFLYDMKAALAGLAWWINKSEYPIYRMDEFRPELLDDVPYNVESLKYPGKKNRELTIMAKFFKVLMKLDKK
jgi:hypothetical protein